MPGASRSADRDSFEAGGRRRRRPAKHGFVALKTIAAYRGGLRIDENHPVWSVFEANEADGASRCRFRSIAASGTGTSLLPYADPSWLKPVIERFRGDAVRPAPLLPVRARGRVARARLPRRLLRPVADDPVRRPRAGDAARGARARARFEAPLRVGCRPGSGLYFLAAKRLAGGAGRGAARTAPAGQALEAGRAILRENALRLYRF